MEFRYWERTKMKCILNVESFTLGEIYSREKDSSDLRKYQIHISFSLLLCKHFEVVDVVPRISKLLVANTIRT